MGTNYVTLAKHACTGRLERSPGVERNGIVLVSQRAHAGSEDLTLPLEQAHCLDRPPPEE